MYKDRGMIKWTPFDALNGFSETIALYKQKKNKKEKPILHEDKLQILDQTLQIAINENKEIKITYFQDGYIKALFGQIKKIDVNFKLIILDSGIKLHISDITDIFIIN